MTVKTLKPYEWTLRTASRWMKVRFGIRETTSPYFIHHGRRYHFSDIERLYYPPMYRDADGKEPIICGSISLGLCGFYVELDPDGEYARLWEVVTDVE